MDVPQMPHTIAIYPPGDEIVCRIQALFCPAQSLLDKLPIAQDALISLLKQPGSAQHLYLRSAPGAALQPAAT